MLRRELLTFALLTTLVRRSALAGPARSEARKFLQRIDEASRALLSSGRQLEWQSTVEEAARAVDLDDLRRAIDFEKLAPAFGQHDTAGGESLRIPGLRLACATKVFCLRQGEAITPHGHRNMASMHLVLGGELRVRHFEKLRDERRPAPGREGLAPAGGFLVLRPSIDRISRPGDASSISGERDNVHWFVARSDRAFTFDCIVSDLRPVGYSYAIDLVDPDRAEKLADGSLRAPIIGWDESLRRYGHAG